MFKFMISRSQVSNPNLPVLKKKKVFPKHKVNQICQRSDCEPDKNNLIYFFPASGNVLGPLNTPTNAS